MLFDDRVRGIEVGCDVLGLRLGFRRGLFRRDGLRIDRLDGFVQIGSGCIGFVSRLLGRVRSGLCLIGGCLCSFDCGIHFGLHVLNLLGEIGSDLLGLRSRVRNVRLDLVHFRLQVGTHLIRLRSRSIRLLLHVRCGIVQLPHVNIPFDHQSDSVGLFGHVRTGIAVLVARRIICDRVNFENRALRILVRKDRSGTVQITQRFDRAGINSENADMGEIGWHAVMQRAIPRDEHAVHGTRRRQPSGLSRNSGISNPFGHATV